MHISLWEFRVRCPTQRLALRRTASRATQRCIAGTRGVPEPEPALWRAASALSFQSSCIVYSVWASAQVEYKYVTSRHVRLHRTGRLAAILRCASRRRHAFAQCDITGFFMHGRVASRLGVWRPLFGPPTISTLFHNKTNMRAENYTSYLIFCISRHRLVSKLYLSQSWNNYYSHLFAKELD